MKKLGLLITVGLFFLSVAGVKAQTSNSATADATAKIISGIEIKNSGQSLAFGNIISPSSGNIHVTVDKNGGITTTGGDDSYLAGGNVHPAKFEVKDANDLNWKLTFSVVSNLELEGHGSGTLELEELFNNASTTKGSGNEKDITVGGRIKIDSEDKLGKYRGSFKVTATYE